MSILFNRIAIIALIYCILHDIISLSILNQGIGLHGGLLHVTNITQIFHIFIFFISILILQLTSFYPRKIILDNKNDGEDKVKVSNITTTYILNKYMEYLCYISHMK